MDTTITEYATCYIVKYGDCIEVFPLELRDAAFYRARKYARNHTDWKYALSSESSTDVIRRHTMKGIYNVKFTKYAKNA